MKEQPGKAVLLCTTVETAHIYIYIYIYISSAAVPPQSPSGLLQLLRCNSVGSSGYDSFADFYIGLIEGYYAAFRAFNPHLLRRLEAHRRHFFVSFVVLFALWAKKEKQGEREKQKEASFVLPTHSNKNLKTGRSLHGLQNEKSAD